MTIAMMLVSGVCNDDDYNLVTCTATTTPCNFQVQTDDDDEMNIIIMMMMVMMTIYLLAQQQLSQERRRFAAQTLTFGLRL